MYQVRYIEYGKWLPLITMKSYKDAKQVSDQKKEQCGGMWTVVTLDVVQSYEDAMAMIGKFDPYDGKGKK